MTPQSAPQPLDAAESDLAHLVADAILSAD